MQINRLFEIVYILLDTKLVTAQELAERFEVSVRTVYRDVEVLSAAGIPVCMSQGRGGGISLVDNFVLNKSVLSEKEQQDILAALHGLGITRYPDSDKVLSKLSTLFNKNVQNWIEVDFSDWSGNTEKWDILKSAILHKKIITFTYFGSSGEKTERRVMPVQLWFKEKTWYLKAVCTDKNALRTFKLTRMRNERMSAESFTDICMEEMPVTSPPPQTLVTLILKIDASQAYRVYDEFDEQQISQTASGDFIVTLCFPENEWVYGYVLSFGCFAEVLEPPHIRTIIIQQLQDNLKKYI